MTSSKAATAIAVFLALVLVAIIVAPNIFGYAGTTKYGKAQADESELASAIDMFRLDCGRYPTTKEGLEALHTKPKGAIGWKGPYIIQEIPLAPSWQPYEFQSPGPNGKGYEVRGWEQSAGSCSREDPTPSVSGPDG